ncbi:GntR family transcriptional regulator [Alcaligenes endophyticus]|uniref:GntR family transcriptional regulator n=1 Tax=Alcaligenes endophyticus TaxID=1929088 RepID=A0ABT8EJG7_9BURK|nr:GntR family transcriptional regulator [Alcaligenes endophyticus]MCX5591757.1 GntR family transcriptional regulator [Alcaligenes endophyticus]MDN4121434.1 GntR family transcriptional regulator [Alcaligenes endophyticus]
MRLSISPSRPLDPTAHIPLFEQLKECLRQDILKLRLAPGQKLPSEQKMQQQFGVSRITVRQALSALQSDGLIETINGKGSFVTRPANAPRLGMLSGFFDYMRSRGKVAQGRVLSVRKAPSSKLISDALKVPAGTVLTTIQSLRLVNDTPVTVGRIVAPCALAEQLLQADLDNEDVMTLLESDCHIRLESTHIEASAVTAGEVRARQLEIASGSPLLRIRFVPHDLSGKALIFAEMYFRPDQFSYRAIIRR